MDYMVNKNAIPADILQKMVEAKKNIIMEIEQSLLALGEIQMWVDFL